MNLMSDNSFSIPSLVISCHSESHRRKTFYFKLLANSYKHSTLNFEQQEQKEWLTLLVPETKIAEFANSVDPDEVVHDEPPHLHLHCFPYSL